MEQLKLLAWIKTKLDLLNIRNQITKTDFDIGFIAGQLELLTELQKKV